jgi:hypothetical protein
MISFSFRVIVGIILTFAVVSMAGSVLQKRDDINVTALVALINDLTSTVTTLLNTVNQLNTATGAALIVRFIRSRRHAFENADAPSGCPQRHSWYS